jgi:hypothetical protein
LLGSEGVGEKLGGGERGREREEEQEEEGGGLKLLIFIESIKIPLLLLLLLAGGGCNKITLSPEENEECNARAPPANALADHAFTLCRNTKAHTLRCILYPSDPGVRVALLTVFLPSRV